MGRNPDIALRHGKSTPQAGNGISSPSLLASCMTARQTSVYSARTGAKHTIHCSGGIRCEPSPENVSPPM